MVQVFCEECDDDVLLFDDDSWCYRAEWQDEDEEDPVEILYVDTPDWHAFHDELENDD